MPLLVAHPFITSPYVFLMKPSGANVSSGNAAQNARVTKRIVPGVHAASRCDALHLCEQNITVPSLTPLCQNLCAQLVSSGALRLNKPAKNEHLGGVLPASSSHSAPTAASVAQDSVTVRHRWIRVTQCIICLFRAGVMQPEKEVLWWEEV